MPEGSLIGDEAEETLSVGLARPLGHEEELG